MRIGCLRNAQPAAPLQTVESQLDSCPHTPYAAFIDAMANVVLKVAVFSSHCPYQKQDCSQSAMMGPQMLSLHKKNNFVLSVLKFSGHITLTAMRSHVMQGNGGKT